MTHAHLHSDGSQTDLTESKQLLEDRPDCNTETLDPTINIALDDVPERQDVPCITLYPDGKQELPQRNSPVSRLPFEVLFYIFELYLVCLGDFTYKDDPAHALFRLAQVCKFWREVAESDPRFWTSIHFYFPESHQSREKDLSKIKPVFDNHLKRSGALPISLTFTDHRTYHSATDELISLVVDQLRTHAQRWKRISLQLSGAYFPLLFKFTPCDLSSLEHLHISGDVFTQFAVLHLNLEHATSLKSFTYSGPGPSMNDNIDLHWESLAKVSLEFAPHCGGSYTLFRQFGNLTKCQNIISCSLGIDRTRRINGSQTITLPHLQTLRVRRLSPLAHARTVIDPLVLPQLQRLEIDASNLVGWNQRWHDRNFSRLLTRSGCTLCYLSIQDVDFPNDEFVRCLALSPELTSLRFIPCPRAQNISDVIHKLDVTRTPTDRMHGHGQRQQSASTGPLVPQLREITLATSVEGYLQLMMTMFRSRVGPSARAVGVTALRRAKVIFFDMWHDTGADRVRGPEHRLMSFRADLAQWVSENVNESGNEDGLEASMVVDAPYVPEYIDIQ